jgi:hypothetical protein
MTTETITWTPVEASTPDAELTVLVALADDADEPTWLGFYDDSFDEGERWRDACTGGPFARRVKAWAQMPGGPKA